MVIERIQLPKRLLSAWKEKSNFVFFLFLFLFLLSSSFFLSFFFFFFFLLSSQLSRNYLLFFLIKFKKTKKKKNTNNQQTQANNKHLSLSSFCSSQPSLSDLPLWLRAAPSLLSCTQSQNVLQGLIKAGVLRAQIPVHVLIFICLVVVLFSIVFSGALPFKRPLQRCWG